MPKVSSESASQGGDLLVGEPARQQLEHPDLARGQTRRSLAAA
jgi:hypothetical protein